jgi:hypothetical protein
VGLKLDGLHYELHDAPCLEALRTAKVLSAQDMRDEQRWNGYPSRALLHGVHSILSIY